MMSRMIRMVHNMVGLRSLMVGAVGIGAG